MSLTASCSSCGKKFKVPEERAGKRFRCACGGIVAVPLVEVEEVLEDYEEEDAVLEEYDELEPYPAPQRVSRRSYDDQRTGKKRKSSAGKSLRIAGLAGGIIAALAVVGVGGYFAVQYLFGFNHQLRFGSGAAAYTIDSAWIPAEVNAVYVIQPKKFFESDLIKAFDPERRIVGSTHMTKEFAESLELMVFPELGRSTYGWTKRDSCKTMILHFSTPMEARERLKGMLKVSPPSQEWQEAQAGGKKYWRSSSANALAGNGFGESTSSTSGDGKSETALYAPDDRTLVLGNELTLKRILTESYSSTPLRSLLRNSDFQHEIMVFATNSPNKELNPFDAMEFLSADSLRLVSMLPNLVQNMVVPQLKGSPCESITVGFSGSNPDLFVINLENKNGDTATAAEAGLLNAKSQIDNSLTILSRGKPDDRMSLSRKLLDLSTVEKKGSTVTLTIKKPEDFTTEFMSVVKRIVEKERQSQAMNDPFAAQNRFMASQREALEKRRMDFLTGRGQGSTSPANSSPGSGNPSPSPAGDGAGTAAGSAGSGSGAGDSAGGRPVTGGGFRGPLGRGRFAGRGRSLAARPGGGGNVPGNSGPENRGGAPTPASPPTGPNALPQGPATSGPATPPPSSSPPVAPPTAPPVASTGTESSDSDAGVVIKPKASVVSDSTHFQDVVLSPDGKFVLVRKFLPGVTAELWEFPAGQQRESFKFPEELAIVNVTPVGISPDGKLGIVAKIHAFKYYGIYDLKTGKHLRDLDTGLRMGVTGTVLRATPQGEAVFTSDKKTMIVPTDTGAVAWDTSSALVTWVFNRDESVTFAKFLNGSKTLVTAANKSIQFHNVESKKQLRKLDIDATWAMAMNIDGSLLATLRSAELIVFDGQTGQELKKFPTLDLAMGFKSLAFLPDGKTLIYPHRDGSIRLADARTGRTLVRLVGHTAVSEFKVSPDGTKLVSLGSFSDHSMKYWELPAKVAP